MATKYYYADADGDDSGSSEENAYVNIETAIEGIAAGDILYLKKSSSRVTTGDKTLDMASDSDTAVTIIEGYETTPGDGGQWQGTGYLFFNTGGNLVVKNIDLETSDANFVMRSNINNTFFYNCRFRNTNTSANNEAVRITVSCHFVNCYFNADMPVSTARGTVQAVSFDGGSFHNCVFRGQRGLYLDNVASNKLNVTNCIFTTGEIVPMINGIDTALITGSSEAVFCNITGNSFFGFTGDGIALRDLPDPAGNPNLLGMIQDNIFYGTSATNGINIEDTSHTTGLLVVGNAYGGVTNQINGGGTNFQNLDAVPLVSDPFVDGANLDFRLTGVSGGGADCRSAAYPTTFQGLTFTNKRDIGAVGHSGLVERISVS